MSLLSYLIGIEPFGKLALKYLKRKGFKVLELSAQQALDKQHLLLQKKFARMRSTSIGKKFGINSNFAFERLPITDYADYEPYYSNPKPQHFLYPLESYKKVRTSGTSGSQKWFMISKEMIVAALKETAILDLLAVFHNGEKSTLEFGDQFYVNSGPGQFASGTTVGQGSKSIPLIELAPNVNLSYKDKVAYFINNYQKVDGAFMLASTLLNQVIPKIGHPIKLKGFATLDTADVEAHRKEIEEFTGTIPRSFFSSTEALLSSVPSIQYSMGFVFDWRRAITEFVPTNKENSPPISLAEVKVGGIYQLLYTDLVGELTRYKLPDAFKCIATGDNVLNTSLPVFRYHARVDKMITLNNFARIDENELVSAFEEAKIAYSDFTAREEEEGGLAYIVIYIETLQEPKTIRERLHKTLYEMDGDYKSLVDYFEYVPLKIRQLKRGTFDRFLQKKMVSIPKVTKINMSKEDFKKLQQLM